MHTLSICVAGKNKIAIAGLTCVRDHYANNANVYAIGNRSDDLSDGWQPSFLKFASNLSDVHVISLNEAENVPNLYFFSLEFDQIIKPEKFKSHNLFNIHFSLLPKYKGMYTSAHPLLNGENESGCTLHRIDAGIDTGPIIAQEKFTISYRDTAKDLYMKYIDCATKLFEAWLEKIIEGNIDSTSQEIENSTYYSKTSIDYNKLMINLKATSNQYNQIRAYTFRDFQLPTIDGRPVFGTRTTKVPTCGRPVGNISYDDPFTIRLSTIDYDLIVLVDRFKELIQAVESENINAISKIIRHNPKLLEETTKRGWSPLIISAYNGYTKSMETLLNLGANPNDRNQKGTTALMYAKTHSELTGNLDGCKILLGAGADLFSADMYGKNIFNYLSCEKEYTKRVCRFLDSLH